MKSGVYVKMKQGRTGIANGSKRRGCFFRYCRLCGAKFHPYGRDEKLCGSCFIKRTRRKRNKL